LTPPRGGGDFVQPDQKRVLYQAMAWAEEQYHEYFLRAPEAEAARRYVASRGITDHSVQRFRLGFAPNAWDWLLKRPRPQQLTLDLLEKVDLIKRRASGPGIYDVFRGRVLFPIRDPEGRPIALGGRILPELADDKSGKYVNSRETPLFSKSRVLYGLDVARDSLAKSRSVLVTEGYTDCLIAQQCGLTDAVAVLGTALGEAHLKLLRRFADRIVLVLDGDDAGRNRAAEVLEIFVAEQVDLRIVTLPSDLDPCDFLLRNGSEAFRELVQNAPDALTHAFRVATHGIDQDNLHAMDSALEGLLSMLAKAPRLRADTSTEARVREQKALERLAFLFRIPEVSIRARLGELRRRASWKAPAAAETTEKTAAPAIDLWERSLLEILLQQPDLLSLALAQVRPDELRSPICREIYVRCCALHALGTTPDFARLMLEFEDSAVKSLIVELDEQGQAKASADAAQQLADLLQSYLRRREDHAQRRQADTIRQEGMDAGRQMHILNQLIEQKRSRQGISSSTEG
jgi:DNA primase